MELKVTGLSWDTRSTSTRQGRPGWKNKTEEEDERAPPEYADLVAAEGGLACRLQLHGLRGHLEQVPDVLRWAGRNIDRVHTVVFILYRAARQDIFEYYAGETKVDMGDIVYALDDERRRTNVQAREVAEVIARNKPSYQPAAYLAGTVDPTSFKWLIAMQSGDSQGIHRVPRSQAHRGDPGGPSSLVRALPRLREPLAPGGRAGGDARDRSLRPERTGCGRCLAPLDAGKAADTHSGASTCSRSSSSSPSTSTRRDVTTCATVAPT